MKVLLVIAAGACLLPPIFAQERMSEEKGNPGNSKNSRGLKFERSYTEAGVSPYDSIEWDIRDAVIAASQ